MPKVQVPVGTYIIANGYMHGPIIPIRQQEYYIEWKPFVKAQNGVLWWNISWSYQLKYQYTDGKSELTKDMTKTAWESEDRINMWSPPINANVRLGVYHWKWSKHNVFDILKSEWWN